MAKSFQNKKSHNRRSLWNRYASCKDSQTRGRVTQSDEQRGLWRTNSGGGFRRLAKVMGGGAVRSQSLNPTLICCCDHKCHKTVSYNLRLPYKESFPLQISTCEGFLRTSLQSDFKANLRETRPLIVPRVCETLAFEVTH